MLAPDFAAALNEKLAQPEEEAEESQIAAMFEARENYTDVRTGDLLKAGALGYFDDNADALVARI